MKFNKTLSVLILASMASITVYGQQDVSTQTDSSSSKPPNSNAKGLEANMPPCLLKCAQTASTSQNVGCQNGLMDMNCICPKKDVLLKETMKCILKAKDQECKKFVKDKKQIKKGKKAFIDLCKGSIQKNDHHKLNTTVSAAGGTSVGTAAPIDSSQQQQQQQQQQQGPQPNPTHSNIGSNTPFPPNQVTIDQPLTSSASSPVVKGAMVFTTLLFGVALTFL